MYCSRSKKGDFFTFLPKNYHHQLKLPKNFVKNCMRNGLPETSSTTVTLKGPSGHTWAVDLMRKDGELYFKKGWDIFVKDHNLKENDGLFFTYNSGVFDVLMFDNGDSCEKANSYFVRKCQGSHHRSNGSLIQRRRAESETEEVESEEDSVEIIEPKKRPRYREKSITISDNDEEVREEEEEEADSNPPPRLLGRVSLCGQQRFGGNSKAIVRKTEVSITDDNNEDSEDDEIRQVKPLEVQPLAILSGLRTVESKEKHSLPYRQAVCEGARRGTPHFVVLMQPSYVSGNFFLAIPAKFLRSHLPREHKDVSLEMNGKTWESKFYYYNKGNSSGFARLGWQDFVCDNKLEVGDACLFEPTSSSSSSSKPRNKLTFNVSIFRNVM